MSETKASKRRPWSAQFADRFQCVVSDSFADWLDSEVWRHPGPGEFCNAISPQELLGPAPECIWPGLMHCDFIPLLGNDAGDWLCIRIDDRGHTDQIVHWYHGGGDWIPWGRTLAEAVLLDAVFDRLPGPSRRHAEPAETPQRSVPTSSSAVFQQWARKQLPDPAGAVFDTQPLGHELASRLLDSNVSEIAIRCELIMDLLTHPERAQIHSYLGEDVHPKRLTEWSFDLGRVPDQQQAELKAQGLQLLEHQHWEQASAQAKRITEIAPYLAWPWDLCGYAAERSGEIAAAIDCYQRAAQCSVFTDQSIRLDTHWASDSCAKFAVSRLHQLQPELVKTSVYYQALMGPDTQQRRMNVTDYWLAQASISEESGDDHRTLQCLTAAAWDVGVDSITGYAALLDRIAEAANRVGQPARSELAATHRRCLQERYGL